MWIGQAVDLFLVSGRIYILISWRLPKLTFLSLRDEVLIPHMPARIPCQFLIAVALTGRRWYLKAVFVYISWWMRMLDTLYWLRRTLKEHSQVSLFLRGLTQFLSSLTDCSSGVWFLQFFTYPKHWTLSDGEGLPCRLFLWCFSANTADSGSISCAAGACSRRSRPGPILTISHKSFKFSGSTLRCLISFELISV